MNDPSDFLRLAEELKAAVASLLEAVEREAPRVDRRLEAASTPGTPSPESSAELHLRDIGRRIEVVMQTYDRMLDSINAPAWFEAHFLLSELNDEDRRQVWAALSKYRLPSRPPPPAGPPPRAAGRPPG